MSRWEQYEVWAQNGDNWERLGWFRDFDIAKALMQSRRTGVRLVHSVYEDGRVVQTDVIAEIRSGATREH